jgi:hypothetical protein
LDEDRLKNRASDSKRNKADRQKYVLGLYKTEVYRYTLQMDPNAVLGITMIHQWMFHVFFSSLGAQPPQLCPSGPPPSVVLAVSHGTHDVRGIVGGLALQEDISGL